MTCQPFCCGVALGLAAGTCLGVRLKSKEKRIRRTLNRAVRNMETVLDTMSR
jgi:hypothetical protein